MARALRWLQEYYRCGRDRREDRQAARYLRNLAKLTKLRRRALAIASARVSRFCLSKTLVTIRETAFYEFSLADAVITELARVRSLIVRPSSVIVKYQGKQFDPGEVGRELSVDAILTASFLRAGRSTCE